MIVEAGKPFTTSLVAPAGDITDLGARVEVPVSRAIAAYWIAATLDGTVWTVTITAPETAGDFLLVWRTSDPEPPAFEAFIPLTTVATSDLDVSMVSYPDVDADSVRPTVDDVAALERSRTDEAGGEEATTFTDDTRPSTDEVDTLIDQASLLVLSELRPAFNPDYYDRVKHAIVLYTAILIEGSYFREQLGQGAVGLWQGLYASVLAGLKQNIEQDLQRLSLVRGLEPTPLPPMPTYPH